MTPEDKPRPLSSKQRVFVDEYLKCFNASEAARRAGYSGAHLHTNASKLLQITTIKDEISARLQASHMSADEALMRVSDEGRGDIGDLVDDNGLIDLRVAREKGMTKLIRKIKQKTITHIGKTDSDGDTEITEIEFEMYDAQKAKDMILRVHGCYVEKTETTGTLTIAFSADDLAAASARVKACETEDE